MIVFEHIESLTRRAVQVIALSDGLYENPSDMPTHGGQRYFDAGLCGKCTSKHQREEAERHFVPESEERHVCLWGRFGLERGWGLSCQDLRIAELSCQELS